MHTASFVIPAPPAEARVLHAALAVEADEGPEGTRLVMEAGPTGLHLVLEAEDLSGLRAAVHSALRLLDAARRSAAVA